MSIPGKIMIDCSCTRRAIISLHFGIAPLFNNCSYGMSHETHPLRFCSLSRDKFHRFWCEKWELSAAGKLLRGGVSCGHGLLTKLKFCSEKEKQFLVNDY